MLYQQLLGTTSSVFVPDSLFWLTATLSVSISIVLMQLLKTRPPGDHRIDSGNWLC
jgi:hypothetical protein